MVTPHPLDLKQQAIRELRQMAADFTEQNLVARADLCEGAADRLEKELKEGNDGRPPAQSNGNQ